MTKLKILKKYYFEKVNPDQLDEYCEPVYKKDELEHIFKQWLNELHNYEIYVILDKYGI